jgi:MFS family permease
VRFRTKNPEERKSRLETVRDEGIARSDAELGALGLPKRVWLLGWVSFFADVCSEIVYPVVPIFLRTVLGVPMAFIGVVEGLAEGTASFMNGVAGLHSDRTGRRAPYIRWGYALSAVGKPIVGLATGWGLVACARVLDRFGKGLRTTARDALIADVAPPEKRGRTFGMHRTMDTAGALVGVAMGLLLLYVLPGQYRLIFAIAFVPGVVAWALTLKVRDVQNRASAEERRRVSWRSLPKSYWWILAPNVLFAIANSSDVFLLLRAKDLGLTDFNVVLAYMAYNVTYVLVSYPAGRLSDKVGRWWLIAGSWTLYAGVYLGFSLTGVGALWPLFMLYGGYIGISKGVSKALVADYAPKEAKGTALGVFNMATGTFALAASVLTGVVWDAFGYAVAFQVCAGLALLAVLTIPVSILRSRRLVGQGL